MSGTAFSLDGLDTMKMTIAMKIEGMEEKIIRALNAVLSEMTNWIKNNHASMNGWQDRTGNLTNSISYQPAYLTERGSILGIIYAGMSYAIYVEWKNGHWVLSGAFTEYKDKILGMISRYMKEQGE